MLTQQNVEAELSYAYLHAVASKAGFSCEYRNRHLDGAGVDATVTHDDSFLAADSKLCYVQFDVQLKATYKILSESEGHFSYALEMAHYEKLRAKEIGCQRILVVLRLPPNPEEWLKVDEGSLVAKRCAFWVSLYGAPAVQGQASKTVYIPTANVLSPSALENLMTRYSRQEVIPYAAD